VIKVGMSIAMYIGMVMSYLQSNIGGFEMTLKKLEEKIRSEVKDEVKREIFISLIWQGFKVKRILEMLAEYKSEVK
jgi:hypothetical protein